MKEIIRSLESQIGVLEREIADIVQRRIDLQTKQTEHLMAIKAIIKEDERLMRQQFLKEKGIEELKRLKEQ